MPFIYITARHVGETDSVFYTTKEWLKTEKGFWGAEWDGAFHWTKVINDSEFETYRYEIECQQGWVAQRREIPLDEILKARDQDLNRFDNKAYVLELWKLAEQRGHWCRQCRHRPIFRDYLCHDCISPDSRASSSQINYILALARKANLHDNTLSDEELKLKILVRDGVNLQLLTKKQAGQVISTFKSKNNFVRYGAGYMKRMY